MVEALRVEGGAEELSGARELASAVIPGLAAGENPEPTNKLAMNHPVVGSGLRFAAPE
jgi:hypothetical protein